MNKNKLINSLRKNIIYITSRTDYIIIVLMYLLTIISTLFVYSATRNMQFVYKNIIWIGVGTFIYFILLFINYNIIERYIYYIYTITIIILLYAILFGSKKLGAQRWISLFGFELQPSEFAKIIACIVLSYNMVKNLGNKAKNFLQIVIGIIPIIPILILIFLQPDLGTTLIICFSYTCILFLSNSNIRPLIFIFIALCIMSVPVYKYGLKDYQKTRIEVFLNPEKDRQGKGWHITQSKISIGSGSVIGKGILEGSQSRLKFLPEPQTDFIFSVISEETGFIGSVSVLGIYFLLITRLLIISTKIENYFGKYIIFGIAGIFLAHVLINVGMTLGLVPVTGKPLLLLSYGGSSFISSFCMLALVQNVKIYDKI